MKRIFNLRLQYRVVSSSFTDPPSRPSFLGNIRYLGRDVCIGIRINLYYEPLLRATLANARGEKYKWDIKKKKKPQKRKKEQTGGREIKAS